MDWKQFFYGVFLASVALKLTRAQSEKQNFKTRSKRFLSFRPGQRFLFRVNGREDAVYDITSWAHGWGFRANYDIIQPLHSFPFHFITRRDVHNEVETLINLHGFSGRDCLLKVYCMVTRDNVEGGIFFKALRIIFGKREKYINEEVDCEQLQNQCPLSFLQLVPYTDLIA